MLEHLSHMVGTIITLFRYRNFLEIRFILFLFQRENNLKYDADQ